MDTDPHDTDPGLLNEHSRFRAYTAGGFEYPSLRVFFRQHVKAEELSPPPLPLLVFVPGLGGSVAQFHPLLRSLVDLAPCLAVDWPGGGRSGFAPTAWGAYTTSALAELLRVIVEDHRDADAGQDVVLVGHSMGSAVSVALARLMGDRVLGVVGICPVANARAGLLARALLGWVPDWLMDLWRAWDARGGPESASVRRFVGGDAPPELKLLQHRFNRQSRTPVWRRMAYGALTGSSTGIPGAQAWADLAVPVYLIAGADDHITPPTKHVDDILRAMRPSAAPVSSVTLPSPADHALLYRPGCVRVLAGLVSDFLSASITPRLSLAWQLQHLSREGRWDVKNLAKWRGVAPVSDSIGSVFRVTKTLREVDDVHCPRLLVASWGHLIKDMIDLSLDQPVYDPRGLERGGIHYHKFPTVSKVPPDARQVDAFIRLVDDIRAAHPRRAQAEAWLHPEAAVVGVHCHYGFNRSGYFVVCYLVERCGYSLPDAIQEFARAKPNGIKHSHFLDKLYMRYNLDRSALI